MDIFAHSIWAAIAAKKYNTSSATKHSQHQPIKIGWAAFWGVFPDLFAFGIPFVGMIALIFSGDIAPGFMWPGSSVVAERIPWIADFISTGYKISHSFVIFAGIFLAVWAVPRRAPLVLLGWLLHILIDMFSHAAEFFPTPIFWPLSDAKFLHGTSWADPRFMIVNYGLMLVAFALVFLKRRK